MDRLDENLDKHIDLARQGRAAWMKLCEQHHIDSNTLVLLLPECKADINRIALKHLEEYAAKKKLSKKIVFTVDENVIENREAQDFTIPVERIDDQECKAILQFYCLYDFNPNLVIASLSQPYGRIGIGALQKGLFTLEELCVAMWYGIYL